MSNINNRKGRRSRNNYEEKPKIDQSAFTLGSLPQFDEEAEIAISTALIYYPETTAIIMAITDRGWFYFEKYGIIFDACQSLFMEGLPIDLLSVKEKLIKSGKLDEIGGLMTLISLGSNAINTLNVDYYSRLIQEKHITRDAIRIGNDIKTMGFDHSVDAFELVDYLQSQTYNLIQSLYKKQAISFETITTTNVIELARRMEITTGVTGIPTGFYQLDELTSGWQKQNVIVVGARPGMGKTALALYFAIIASKKGYPVAIFSLEMSASELTFRIQSMESNVESEKIRSGRVNIDEFNRFKDSALSNKDLPIHIDDSAHITVLEFSAKVKRMAHKHGIKLVIIDYIQLMNAGSDFSGSREQEISLISRVCKEVAKDCDIPIIVLSQLNRGVESRGKGGNIPMLADLRECLSLETSNIYTDLGVQSNCNSRINLLSLHKNKIVKMKSNNIPKLSNVVYRLKTGTGRYVDATLNHPVLTTDGYKKLSDITKTDSIAIAISWSGGDTYISESKFIGWMLGNGCMYGYNVPGFITNDKIISDLFVEFINERFGFKPKNHPHYKSKVYQWDITNSPTGNRTKKGNNVTAWLKDNDLWGKKAKDKIIPEWFIKSADEKSVCELLQGLFETDGSISMGNVENISYSTTSIILANQIMYLLARIGIIAHIDDGRVSNKATTECYKIRISASDEKMNFIKKITLDGYKGDKLRSMKLTNRQSYHSNVLGRQTTLNIANESALRIQTHGDRRLTKKRLIEALKCGNDEFRKKYSWLATPHIFWDRVDSIKLIGEVDVFDRSVPVSNNFVVNGVIVHNSGAIEQDADIVLFPHRPEYYKEEFMSDGLTPSVDMAELHIAKHRNGKTGAVMVRYEKAYVRFGQYIKYQSEPVNYYESNKIEPSNKFSHENTPREDSAPF